jgi:hypothetical protein
MTKNLHIDHLVYAVPDLAEAVVELESRFGVAPSPGGAHVGRGTFNALLGLGGRTYLEIIGPDPAQPDPTGPRPFGIDELESPRLVGWCAAPTRPLDEVVAIARGVGYDPGDPQTMTRRRPDGVVLEWSLTLTSLDAAEGGVLPFFIDWGRTVHPSASIPVGGSLVALDLFHPQPRSIDIILSAISDEALLGDEPSAITLNYADRAALTAEILTANGAVVLS